MIEAQIERLLFAGLLSRCSTPRLIACGYFVGHSVALDNGENRELLALVAIPNRDIFGWSFTKIRFPNLSAKPASISGAANQNHFVSRDALDNSSVLYVLNSHELRLAAYGIVHVQ
jgi:hypothetical protein